MTRVRAAGSMIGFVRRCAATGVVLVAILGGLSACGGGGAAPSVGTSTGGGGLPKATAPDVALILVGGHAWFAVTADYMAQITAPYLVGEMEAAGYSVESFSFVDEPDGPGGFGELKARLAAIRDEWIRGRTDPTRVVIVAHSHGGPWAHAATRDVPDCPIHAFVDLDATSYGWDLTHSTDEVLGGNPVDRYAILVTVNPPEYPTIRSEEDDLYDLEDVVFPSVRYELEVVTGSLVPEVNDPTQYRRYDERWNARFDGTVDGLSYLYVSTAHSEPVVPPDLGGTTLVTVKDWILSRL